MKVYRVSHLRLGQEHDGYSYHTNKKDAQKALKEDRMKFEGDGSDDEGYNETFRDTIDEYELELTKTGVMEFLNIHCSYSDNG